MKKVLTVILVVMVAVLFLSGCTMRYVLKDTITPDVVLDKKSSEKVLVVIDNEIKDYVENIHASSLEGSIHTYIITLGGAFYDGLISSVKSKYLNVTVSDGTELSSFDKIIKFSMTEHKLKFVYATELFSTKAVVNYRLGVEMTVIDGKTESVLKTKKLEGNADFEGDANETTVDKYLGQTAKEGIKEVVNKAVSELIQ